MKLDSAGLGWSRRGSRVFVHYPKKGRDGTTAYGAGFEVPDWPPSRLLNDVDRERVLLVESLEDESKAVARAPSVADLRVVACYASHDLDASHEIDDWRRAYGNEPGKFYVIHESDLLRLLIGPDGELTPDAPVILGGSE